MTPFFFFLLTTNDDSSSGGSCFFDRFNPFRTCFGRDDDDDDEQDSYYSIPSSSVSSISRVIDDDGDDDDDDAAALLVFAEQVNALCLRDVTLLDEFAASQADDSGRPKDDTDDDDDLSCYTTISDATEGIAKLQQELTNVQFVPSNLFEESATGSWEHFKDYADDDSGGRGASSITSSFSSSSSSSSINDDDTTLVLFTEQVNSLCICDVGLLVEFVVVDDNGEGGSYDDSSYYSIISDATEGIALLQQELVNVERVQSNPLVTTTPIQKKKEETMIPTTISAVLDCSCSTVLTVTTASASSVVSWELSSSESSASPCSDEDITDHWEYLKEENGDSTDNSDQVDTFLKAINNSNENQHT